MIETIAAGLAIHIGKKGIDWIWDKYQAGQAPIVSQGGQLGFTATHQGRTSIDRKFTVPKRQIKALVFGDLYLPDTITDIITNDEIPLILIIEENQQQTLLFPADLENGYEIYLPQGRYSFYVFLMDLGVDDFLDAEIYAIGLPSREDLSDIRRIDVANHNDIWSIVSEAPIVISGGGKYYLDFILLDTDRVPEFPNFFGDLMGACRVCDSCLYYNDEYSTDWKITNKGNFKCETCGEKNDFAECEKCDSIWFRETKKGNFRCFNCDKKL
ncbi:MAG: hypothetical protein KDI62_18325 [Anaerolineae bacterium]|nr:hypothetical protein [Anaerolineae bacterium]MCB9108769.1 hypothetical protein [Anaerolineales bacterium]